MPGYLTHQSSVAIAGVADLQIRSLLDKQQFHDPLSLAADRGISSAMWPLFGLLWPSGLCLAERLALRTVRPERVLELGCGLGLASLVGHRLGADVTASDCHPLAGEFLAALSIFIMPLSEVLLVAALMLWILDWSASFESASWAKVLAYLYQHGETEVMDIVRQAAMAKGHVPIANVHDAIFFKRRLGADFKSEIEWQMREQTGNPYWHLTPKQIERYTPRSLNAQREVQEHKDRMALEQARAVAYYSGSKPD